MIRQLKVFVKLFDWVLMIYRYIYTFHTDLRTQITTENKGIQLLNIKYPLQFGSPHSFIALQWSEFMCQCDWICNLVLMVYRCISHCWQNKLIHQQTTPLPQMFNDFRKKYPRLMFCVCNRPIDQVVAPAWKKNSKETAERDSWSLVGLALQEHLY